MDDEGTGEVWRRSVISGVGEIGKKNGSVFVAGVEEGVFRVGEDFFDGFLEI